jgi:hypothetical protein
MTIVEVERVLVPRYGDNMQKRLSNPTSNISYVGAGIFDDKRKLPGLQIYFTDNKVCTMVVDARYKGDDFERMVWFKDNQYGRHSIEIGKDGAIMTWHPHTKIEINSITRESIPSGRPGPVSYGVSMQIGWESDCSPFKSIAPSSPR